jgi:starch synthase (maltosyl-transferring)
MKIYNLFPTLAGRFSRWQVHIERAAAMGFDWIFVNPIQRPGRSGSLYSIADYFQINPALLDPRSGVSPQDQLKAAVTAAEKRGVRMMVDLVVNHCAADAKLVKQYPGWFVRDANGLIAHPSCWHDGEQIVWRDLAQFDHEHSVDRESLYGFCRDVAIYLIGLGFTGFRCDAAYQLPSPFWKRLIHEVRQIHPEVVFVAETLGCSPERTRETALAGFDYVFNSAKWWDFSGSWLFEQYQVIRNAAPSISFPESHDTERLFRESNQNVHAMKQRYLFSALFSGGVMMPMGFEFGFQKRLHVVRTRPNDWETPAIDLTGFIRQVNQVKSRHPIFLEDSNALVIDHANPNILVMWKADRRDKSEALIILNKDTSNRQHFRVDNLYHYIQKPPPLIDVSPEWPLDYLPTPFAFELLPGMGRILVTPAS